LSTPVELGLGAAGSGSNPFRGAMDDVRILDRALSNQEITALMGG
jgi:hypothetical protein